MDEDTPTDKLTISLVEYPTQGVVQVNRSADGEEPQWETIYPGADNFTYKEVCEGRVRYVHSGGEGSLDSVKFVVYDGDPNINPGQFFEVPITIEGYNDKPALTQGGAIVVDEHERVDNINNQIVVNNPEADDTLTYTIETIPANGILFYKTTSDGGATWTETAAGHTWDPVKSVWVKDPTYTPVTLTQEQYDQGLSYLNIEDNNQPTDSFKLTVTDQVNPVSTPWGDASKSDTLEVVIKVRGINDAPVMEGEVNNAKVTEVAGNVAKDKGVVILNKDADHLKFGDPELKQVIYYIETGSLYGTLYYNYGQPGQRALAAGSTFTQEDLDGGRISYVHDGSNRHIDSMVFKVSDGSKYILRQDLADAWLNDHNSLNNCPDVFELAKAKEFILNFDVTPTNQAPEFAGLEQLELLTQNSNAAVPLKDGDKVLTIKDPDKGTDYIDGVTKYNENMRLTINANLRNYSHNPDGTPTNNSGDAKGYFGLNALVGDGSQSGLQAAINSLLGPNKVTVTENGEGKLVLEGSIEDLNKVLAVINYQCGEDLDATVYITFEINDLDNGSGTDHLDARGLTAYKFLRIHVSPVNSAPEVIINKPDNSGLDTITGNAASGNPALIPGNSLDVWEDSPQKIFTNKSGNTDLLYLQFNDNDAFGSTDNSITITVTNGTLKNAGLGSKSGDVTTYTLQGTLAQLNAALLKLEYVPADNFNGEADITVRYSDSQNTGGTTSTNPNPIEMVVGVNFTLNVRGLNDAPDVGLNYKDDPDNPGHTNGFDRNEAQYDEVDGKLVQTPTINVNSSTPKDGDGKHIASLKDKISIDDAVDFGKAGVSFDQNTGMVYVTLDAMRWGAAVAGKANGSFSLDGTHSGVTLYTNDTGSAPYDNGSTITLYGTWNDVQNALNDLNFLVGPSDIADDNSQNENLFKIVVTVNDKYNGDSTSPAAPTDNPNRGDNTAETYFLVNVNTQENNPPVISGDNQNIDVYEDLYSATDGVITGSDKAAYIKLDALISGFEVDDPNNFLYVLKHSLTVSEGGKFYFKGDNNVMTEVSLAELGSAGWAEAGLGQSSAELRDFLDSLYFKPNPDWNGTITIKVMVNDQGNTGSVPDNSHYDDKIPSGTTFDEIKALTDGEYLLEDGLALITIKTFTITVKPVNDAPRVNSGKNVSLGEVGEDAGMTQTDTPGGAGTGGQKVGDIFGGSKLTEIGFADPKDTGGQKGQFQGVLVVGTASNPSTEGVWQYYDTTTNKWVDITSPGNNSAIYLSKDAHLRFNPVVDFYGEPGQLTVRLVETAGTDNITAPYDDPALGGVAYPAFLTDGSTCVSGVNLADGGDFGGIKADYRPYTANTVDLKIKVANVYDAPEWGATRPTYETNEDSSILLTGVSFADKDIVETNKNFNGFTLTVEIATGTGAQAGSDAGKLGIDSSKLPAGVTIVSTADGKLVFKGTLEGLNALLSAAGNADGKIKYTPAENFYGSESDLPQVTFTIEDGGHDGTQTNPGDNEPASITLSIKVNPVNDAPTLKQDPDNWASTTDGNHTLKDPFRDSNGGPTILEDQTKTNLPTKTVDQIFGGTYDDDLDARYGGQSPDVENQHTFAGVVIVANGSAGNVDGVWEYLNTSTGKWVPIETSLGDSNGLYLDKATEIRFVPNENFNGNTGQLKAYLADSTIAAGLVTGASIDVSGSKRGDTTPFSVKHVAVGTVVKAVNDAPKWTTDAPDNKAVGTVKAPEDGCAANNGQTVGSLIKNTYFDDSADNIIGGSNPDSLAGILITKVDAPDKDTGGHWEYSTNGTTWTAIDPAEISEANGLYLKITDTLRYVPKGTPTAETDYFGPVYDNITSPRGLHVHLVDSSDPPSDSGPVNLSGSGVGGVTPYSEATRVITAEITPINDAPVLDPNTTIIKEVGCTDPADVSQDQLTWTIDNIIGDKFSDSADGDASQFQGIIITDINVANMPSTTDLVWKYSTDSGITWTSISGGTPFYLPKDAQLRLWDSDDNKYTDPGSGTVEASFTYRVVETDGNNNPEGFTSLDLDNPGNYGQKINDFDPATETGGATRISSDEGRFEVSFSKKEYAPTIDVPADFKFVAQEDTPMYVGGFTIGDGNNDILTVTIEAENGVLTFDTSGTGVTVANNGTGTITLTGKPADLNKALNPNDPSNGQKLAFLHQETHYNGPAKIIVTVDDGHKGGSGGDDGHGREPSSEVFEFKVIPVNDAPEILDLNNNGYGQKVDRLDVEICACDDAEEVRGKTTHTVADLVRDWFSDPQDKLYDELSGQVGSYETDKLEGIIITATNGTDHINWQYSLNGGTDWATINLAPGQGLYLPAEALLRLDPQAGLDHEAAPSFSCLLVETEVKTYDSGDNIGQPILDSGQLQYLEYADQAPGVPFTLNTLATAGTTRVSDIDDPLTIEVAIRNPRPGFECNEPTLKMTEDNELAIDNIKVSHWDGDNSEITVTITPGNGYKGGFNCLPPTGCGVTVSTGPDGELILTGTATAINDFIDNGQVKLSPTEDAHSVEGCRITVSASYYSAQDSADYSSSTNVEYTLTEFVKVNDAPETTGDQTWLPDFTNRPGTEPESQTVADLFGPLFSDARDQQDGCSGNSLRGILITGSLSDPAKEGLWQYFNGSQWVDIRVTDAAGSLYLEAGTELRFKPETGYSGQPGGLTALLVETETTSVSDPSDPRHTTGRSQADRPADFITGQTYDYIAAFDKGGESRVSLDSISLDVIILAYKDVDQVNPPILTENPADTWRDNNSPTTPSIPPWKRTDEIDDFSTNYERNGLDAPHLRHGGGAGDGHQEINLITNTYVGSVCWHITEHINASVSQAGQFLAGAEPVAYSSSSSDSGLAPLNYQWNHGPDGLPSLILNVDDFAGQLGSSPILFSASLADGGELPEWLVFNPTNLTFQITDPSRLTEILSLLVTADDEEGRRIALSFELVPGDLSGVEEAAGTEGTEGENADPAGDMISRSRESGLYLMEAAESFHDLWDSPESSPAQAEAGPYDADLNHKMELCGVDALLLKAQKMLSVLSS